MGANVKKLLGHLRERQEILGVNAFHFHHVLQNNKLELAEYPATAKVVIDAGSGAKDWPLGHPDEVPGEITDVGTSPAKKVDLKMSAVGKAAIKKSARKRSATEMLSEVESVDKEDFKLSKREPDSNTQSSAADSPPDLANYIRTEVQHHPQHQIPIGYQSSNGYQISDALNTSAPETNPQLPNPYAFQPAALISTAGPSHPPMSYPYAFHPDAFNIPPGQSHMPIPPFPFQYPFNHPYFPWNQSSGFFPPSADGLQPNLKPEPTFDNIDPSSIPQGPPIFGDVSHIIKGRIKDMTPQPPNTTQVINGANIFIQPPSSTPKNSPSKSPSKKTPKKGTTMGVDTPSRPNRSRKPSRKLLESKAVKME
jgi:hypothetical protein